GTPDPDAQDGRPLAREVRPPARGALPERAQLHPRPPHPLPQTTRRPGGRDRRGPARLLPRAGALLLDRHRPRLHGPRRGLQARISGASDRKEKARRRVVGLARRPGSQRLPSPRDGPEQGPARRGARAAPPPGRLVLAVRGRGGGPAPVAVLWGTVGEGWGLRFRGM
ncbi:MAG: hypothetical protein AVDCRST_MAG02-863, partial [uncultured Rubrobacteraceae bacterium]